MAITGAFYTRFQWTDIGGANDVQLPHPTDALSIRGRRVSGRSMSENGTTEELLIRFDVFVTLAWVARPRGYFDAIWRILQNMGTKQVAITLDYQGTHLAGTLYDGFNTFFNRGEMQEQELNIVAANPRGTLYSSSVTFRQGV